MSTPLLAVEPADATLRFVRGTAPAPAVGNASLTLSLEDAGAVPAGGSVLFRIQTTSPATYRVRPSQGRVAPGEKSGSAEIAITMATEPTKADKFLVKAVVLTAAETTALPVSAGAEETAVAFSSAVKAGNATFEQRLRVEIAEGATASTPTVSVTSAAAPASAPAQPPAKKDNASLESALRDARDKIALLTAKNADLLKRVEDAERAVVRARAQPTAHDPTVDAGHPATTLPEGLTEAELAAMIRAQAGFPPVLVLLIAIFAFLVGLLF